MIPNFLYKLLYQGFRAAQLSGPARFRLGARRRSLAVERRLLSSEEAA